MQKYIISVDESNDSYIMFINNPDFGSQVLSIYW